MSGRGVGVDLLGIGWDGGVVGYDDVLLLPHDGGGRQDAADGGDGRCGGYDDAERSPWILKVVVCCCHCRCCW